MAAVLLILLVVGYGLSVWSLKRQEHFGERQARFNRRASAHAPRRVWRLRHGELR